MENNHVGKDKKTITSYKGAYLQYVFFMNHKNEFLFCDEPSGEFLSSIDLDLLYARLLPIKLNAAITNTTILIKNTSYKLQLIPVKEKNSFSFPYSEGIEYIITLQDQALFSYIIQKLNQTHFDKNSMKEVLDSLNTALFITNSDGTVIFSNSTYEKSTNTKSSDVIHKNVVDLLSTGVFMPLVTPTIVKTNKELTVLQTFKSGKYAIISGSPIYDSIGNPSMVITCVSVITMLDKANPPKQLVDLTSLNLLEESNSLSIDVIAESQIMRTIVQEAVKVAQYDVSVLLLGDSGVGKEIIASVIHYSSQRKAENFVKINCSAISPALLESELFGYEPGAFTGALNKGKRGLFEVANNGTLLLDEIGDMPIQLQAKLLRVLQNREIYRVGGVSPIKVNVRIIASTNKDLCKMMYDGQFRSDLFYRLNVVSIDLPPLRKRKEDIKPLLLHFIYIYNKKYGTNKKFSDELIHLLENYNWPGNVRELQNLVERLMILCNEDLLLPKHFHSKYSFGIRESKQNEDIQVKNIIPLKDAVYKVEQTLVARALEQTRSTRKAAELLGVSQSTIMRKIREGDISLDEIAES